MSSKDIFECAQFGDLFSLEVVEQVCGYLGFALADVADTLNPSSIVIGDGVSAAGDFLLHRTQHYFDRFTFPEVRSSAQIKLAQQE